MSPFTRYGARSALAALAASGLFAVWWMTDRPTFEDLGIYLGSIRAVASGQGLYSFSDHLGGGFTYPPLAALLLWPVALLPWSLTVVGTAWAAVILVTVLGGVVALSREQPGRQEWQAWLPALFVVTVGSQPVRDALHFGQLSPIVGLLTVCAPLLILRAGIPVGLAAGLKLTPAATWGIWILQRRWRLLTESIATFGLLAALAWAVLPAESHAYWSTLLWDSQRVGDLGSLGNNSWLGLASRHLTGAPAAAVWATGVLACLVLVARHAHRARPGTVDLWTSIVAGYLLALIASPVSWTHHATFLAPLALLVALRTHGCRRAAALACCIIWMVPIYALAKAADGWAADAGALVADLRPVSLLALFAILLVRHPATSCVPETAEPPVGVVVRGAPDPKSERASDLH